MVRICIDCQAVYGCIIGTEKHLCLNCFNVMECPNLFINSDQTKTHGICPKCRPDYYKEVSKIGIS